MANGAYIKNIKNLIAQNNLDEAIKQLLLLLDNSPSLDEVILQSARLSHIRREIRLGLVDYSESNITHNHIREGLLDLIKEVEKQSISPEIHTEIERAISIIGSKNLLVGSNITAIGNVQIGDTTIHHHYYSTQFSHFLPSPTGRIFIFQNIADQKWVKNQLTPQLEAAGLNVHLDFKEYEKSDFEALKQTLADCKAALIVCSDKFTGKEIWLLDGLVDTEYKKMLALRLDDAPVPHGITAQIELNAGENSPEDFRPLLARLLPNEIPVWEPLDKTCIEISAMPNSGAKINLFGRAKELQLLDNAWATRHWRVLNFVAQGGTGKSALFNHWLRTMQSDHFRGASRVLAHSFYSQGTGERVTSADQFINFALTWFGERDFEQRSPWDKGKRLAQLVSEHRTLLILDGLEPLQEGGTVDTGKVKDPALFTLIRDLAKRNEGFCIITSRLHLGGLERQAAGIQQVDLEQVSDAAGRRILQFPGDSDDKVKVMVQGDDEKLEQVVRDFGNHAFALNLLRQWLYAQPGHRIEMADTIPDLPDVPLRKGKHARRVIAAFEKLMGEKGLKEEVRLLRFLGLFDRPVSEEAIAKLHPFQNLYKTLDSLWMLKLIYREKRHPILRKNKEDMVDCHPLVREHYSEVFANEEPEAWQKCHAALYEYYKGLPERLFGKFLPDTLEEMEPLFLAVRHGCAQGDFFDVYNNVYFERISRYKEFYSTDVLGAFSTDLMALANFFEKRWEVISEGIADIDAKATIFNLTGFRLRALGLLDDSLTTFGKALELRIKSEDWREASNEFCNLSQLFLIQGNIEFAIVLGRRSIEYADVSKDYFVMGGFRAIYANALMQAGEPDRTIKKSFSEAEKFFNIATGSHHLLGLWGFMHCEFLLKIGKLQKILDLAGSSIEYSYSINSKLNIGLSRIILGRYFLTLYSSGNVMYGSGETYFETAVNEIRESGYISYLPTALLARATCYRQIQNYPAAEADLEEVLDIAEPYRMRLHLADYYLETARLRLAQARPDDARLHVAGAARLIAETSYHRRDRELRELNKLIENS